MNSNKIKIENYGRLEHEVLQFVRKTWMFQRNKSPPSSWYQDSLS